MSSHKNKWAFPCISNLNVFVSYVDECLCASMLCDSNVYSFTQLFCKLLWLLCSQCSSRLDCMYTHVDLDLHCSQMPKVGFPVATLTKKRKNSKINLKLGLAFMNKYAYIFDIFRKYCDGSLGKGAIWQLFPKTKSPPYTVWVSLWTHSWVVLTLHDLLSKTWPKHENHERVTGRIIFSKAVKLCYHTKKICFSIISAERFDVILKAFAGRSNAIA